MDKFIDLMLQYGAAFAAYEGHRGVEEERQLSNAREALIKEYRSNDAVIERLRTENAQLRARLGASLSLNALTRGADEALAGLAAETEASRARGLEPTCSSNESKSLREAFGNGHRATLEKAIEWAKKYGGEGDLSDLQEIREALGPWRNTPEAGECRCVREDGSKRFNINCTIHGSRP